jgi:type II secretory pathway component PulM
VTILTFLFRGLAFAFFFAEVSGRDRAMLLWGCVGR